MSVIPSGDDDSHPVGRVPFLASLAARIGLTRLVGRLDLGALPPQSRDEARTSVAQATWVSSTVDEYLRGSVSAREAASLRDFADKPLFVVTAGEHPASWMAEQQRLLRLSTNSVQEVVAGASHTDLVLLGRYAARTARAIVAVVDSVRTHGPLNR